MQPLRKVGAHWIKRTADLSSPFSCQVSRRLEGGFGPGRRLGSPTARATSTGFGSGVVVRKKQGRHEESEKQPTEMRFPRQKGRSARQKGDEGQ